VIWSREETSSTPWQSIPRLRANCSFLKGSCSYMPFCPGVPHGQPHLVCKGQVFAKFLGRGNGPTLRHFMNLIPDSKSLQNWSISESCCSTRSACQAKAARTRLISSAERNSGNRLAWSTTIGPPPSSRIAKAP